MENLLDRFRRFFDKTSGQAAEISEALMVIEPVAPFGGRGMVTVLITSASLLSITLLGGVGLASMLVLLLALGLIFLILSAVFGISFDVDPAELFRQHGPW